MERLREMVQRQAEQIERQGKTVKSLRLELRAAEGQRR